MALDTVTTRHSLKIEGKASRSRVCFGDWDGIQIAFSFSALWFQSASALVSFWVWLVLRIHIWSPFSRPYKIHVQSSGWAIVFSIQKRLEGNAKPTEWKTIESPECQFLFDSELLLWAKVELSFLNLRNTFETKQFSSFSSWNFLFDIIPIWTTRTKYIYGSFVTSF